MRKLWTAVVAIAALALLASTAYAHDPFGLDWLDDVKSNGGPPAFVDSAPPSFVETGDELTAEDEDTDEDTEEESEEDADVGTNASDSANVPDWVEDVKADGGPPAWVEDVKADGGPPAWVSTQQSPNAQTRSGR